MLADALGVVSACEDILYVNDIHGSDLVSIMDEALRSVEQELDGLSRRAESCDRRIEWLELCRVWHRARLARKGNGGRSRLTLGGTGRMGPPGGDVFKGRSCRASPICWMVRGGSSCERGRTFNERGE